MSDKLIEAVARAIEEINDDDCPTIDIARAALAAIEKSGTHVIVPTVPDEHMIGQLLNYRVLDEWDYTDAWDSLLIARPKVLP